jgi:hypothetical protein
MQHNAQLHHGVMAALLSTPPEGGGPRRSSPTMVKILDETSMMDDYEPLITIVITHVGVGVLAGESTKSRAMYNHHKRLGRRCDHVCA